MPMKHPARFDSIETSNTLWVLKIHQGKQMPKVVIFEKATQKVVATHPVSFGLMGGQATEADLFDLAWNAAVEDKAVSPIGRDQYDFRIEN